MADIIAGTVPFNAVYYEGDLRVVAELLGFAVKDGIVEFTVDSPVVSFTTLDLEAIDLSYEISTPTQTFTVEPGEYVVQIGSMFDTVSKEEFETVWLAGPKKYGYFSYITHINGDTSRLRIRSETVAAHVAKMYPREIVMMEEIE